MASARRGRSLQRRVGIVGEKVPQGLDRLAKVVSRRGGLKIGPVGGGLVGGALGSSKPTSTPIRRMRSVGCAVAASGHATAVPQRRLMNSRRRMNCPRKRSTI